MTITIRRSWLAWLVALVILAPATARGVGSLTIPNTLANLAAGAQPVAVIDANFTAIATYVNAREAATGLLSARPAAGTSGRWYCATDVGLCYLDSGVAWTTVAGTQAATDDLSGLALAHVSASTQRLTVAAGVAASDDSSPAARVLMSLTSAITGHTAGTWTVGTAQNKLDAGTLGASQTWHVYVIQRVDTGVVDVLFSQSATSPTMPTNYSKKRRIGAFMTDTGSAIIPFFQDGDLFMLATPSGLNTADNNPGTSSVTATASVPNGVAVVAIMNLNTVSGGTAYIFYARPTTVSDTVPAAGASPLGHCENDGGTVNRLCRFEVLTNTSRQWAFRISASAAGVIPTTVTVGYRDRRGRG